MAINSFQVRRHLFVNSRMSTGFFSVCTIMLLGVLNWLRTGTWVNDGDHCRPVHRCWESLGGMSVEEFCGRCSSTVTTMPTSTATFTMSFHESNLPFSASITAQRLRSSSAIWKTCFRTNRNLKNERFIPVLFRCLCRFRLFVADRCRGELS